MPGRLHRRRRRISKKMEVGTRSCCHFQLRPFSPGAAPQGLQISGSVDRRPGTLLVTYIMAGDLERIVLPEPVLSVSRRHELWRRTCFEVFFGIPGQTAYWEGNFSPSGDWNLYRFNDYRQGMAEEQRSDRPSCRAVTTGGSRLELSCSMDIHDLCSDSEVLAAGIACVVLETSGRVSYWAVDHCGARPDFHDRRSFLIQLTATDTSQDVMM